jgi:hypothetical protein
MGLPGDLRPLKRTNEICEEEGCNETATFSLQGETDSFGAEYSYLCTAHKDAYIEHRTKPVWGCDNCGKEAELTPQRDPEEGSYGPVYWHCNECINCFNNIEEDDYY